MASIEKEQTNQYSFEILLETGNVEWIQLDHLNQSEQAYDCKTGSTNQSNKSFDSISEVDPIASIGKPINTLL